jgi:high-affinity iron transporter
MLMAVLAEVLAGEGVAVLQDAGWMPQTLSAAPRLE